MTSIMKLLNRLHQINNLIQRQSTGSPKQLAERLGLSERQVHNYITELREIGLPIEYCRWRQTYFYRTPVHFEISIYVEEIPSKNEKLVYL